MDIYLVQFFVLIAGTVWLIWEIYSQERVVDKEENDFPSVDELIKYIDKLFTEEAEDRVEVMKQ